MSYQFQASSPPATPAKLKNPFGESHPSTTPAGPPPSSAGSLTPAGQPSSFFDSSTFNHNQSFGASQQSVLNNQNSHAYNFSQKSSFSPGPSRVQPSKNSTTGNGLFGRVTKPAARSTLSQRFDFSTNSNASDATDLTQDDAEEDDDAEGEEYDDGRNSRISHGSRYDEEYSDDENMDDDDRESREEYEGDGIGSPNRTSKYGKPPRYNSTTSQNPFARGTSQPGAMTDLLLSSPVRPTLDQNQRSEASPSRNSLLQSTYEKHERPEQPIYGKIARTMAKRDGAAELAEDDKLILGTEDLIRRLYVEGVSASRDDTMLKRALSTIPKELIDLWIQYDESIRLDGAPTEYAAAIGPGPKASGFALAQFLSSLLLQFHHPPTSPSDSIEPPFRASSFALSIRESGTAQMSSVPSVLLAWMYENHDPAPSQLAEIRDYRPSPSAHPFFWETILNSLVRGKVVPVMNALQEAGWQHAKTTVEDGSATLSGDGYSGQTLTNVKEVVAEAVGILSQCPGGQENWNIRNSDWTLFRLRVSQAWENLKIFAEGRSKVSDVRAMATQSLSASTRKAQSQVPWSIYQRLTTLYNLMLGDSLAIIGTSQDWVEATIGLVLWGNTHEEERRTGLSRSQHMTSVAVDGDSPEGYKERIADAFYTATEDTDFQVNSLSIAEVGLAAIFEGDTKAVVMLLQSCSEPVAAAVVEVASLGGWLPKAAVQNLITMDSFDADDMDVLGLDSSSDQSKDLKDDVLISYASELATKDGMEYINTFNKKVTRQGWEIAIEILGRLNSTKRSEQEVDIMLESFSLESSAEIDKLWEILNYLGLNSQAEKIVEKYADSLADSTRKYGEALWYYALAHRSKKVKDVLDLLVSYSLIHSTAWPPASELDAHLQNLIASPKAELAKLSKVDTEAAELLHKMLSGYATLRTFYGLRDAEISNIPQFAHLRPRARRAQASAALMAVLTSSDDNIRGGLYDESRDAVVSVDFLLALLGESLIFVSGSDPILSQSQIYVLLKTIEDIQGVSRGIYDGCESFLQTVITSTPGLIGSNPMDLLKKSSSNLSNSQESFSLLGSTMMVGQLQKSMTAGGMKKDEIKRGWDWRTGLTAGMTGEDVLKMLRFALAKELARTSIAAF